MKKYSCVIYIGLWIFKVGSIAPFDNTHEVAVLAHSLSHRPVQFSPLSTNPVSVNPTSHSHMKLPTVFVQVALSPHISAIRHSSLSARRKLSLLGYSLFGSSYSSLAHKNILHETILTCMCASLITAHDIVHIPCKL